MTTAAERLVRAESLVEDAQRTPADTIREATRLAGHSPADEATCVAWLAVALAHRMRGDLDEAFRVMRLSIKSAQSQNLRRRAGQARTSLLPLLVDKGLTSAALAEAERAEADLTAEDVPQQVRAVDLARLRVNSGIVLQRTGRDAEALDCFNEAQPVLSAAGDIRWEVVLLSLRGPLLAYRGLNRPAVEDLNRALLLATTHGMHGRLIALHANLGFAAQRAGDLPEALGQLDKAILAAKTVGRDAHQILPDRAETLLAAGLAREALTTALEAVDGLEEAGFAYDAAESRLIAARAALAARDPAAAGALASAARADFSRQHRPNWAAWARHVELAAQFDAGQRTARLFQALLHNAARLEKAGWLLTPQQAKLLAARTAQALGRTGAAEELLEQVATARYDGPAELRVLAWEAKSALCESRGDRAGAGRAIMHGLRIVEQYADTVGATDMRAGMAGLGASLAAAGLRLALAGDSAGRILLRAEQHRATVLHRRPVRPPDDREFAARLTELRAVRDRIDKEALTGKDVAHLQVRGVRLEREVQQLARQAPGAAQTRSPRFEAARLRTALGDRALVEYLRVDDDLHAVTVVDGRARHHRLGAYSAILSELESLRFSLGRMALKFGSPVLQQSAQLAFEHARGELDQALLAPLLGRIEGRELVLVPTGSLHALAWPLLPSCLGQPMVVAPSARSWLRAAAAPTPDLASPCGQVVLALGPDLERAEAEIEELARIYPRAKPLTGQDASADAVRRALDGAALAHLAAHGQFRADNPLFSSLKLADGQLTVYDLEGLERAPEVLVLSSCDTALSGVQPGDEMMGMASAVFALGTRTLIAAVVPVGDEDTRALMTEFHHGLAAGVPAARALAAAQQVVPDARGFICFGAG
jgi:tetratricopeptide (TPR) repeat protein